MVRPHSLLLLLLDLLLLLLGRANPQQQISTVDLSALHEIKNSLTELRGADFFST
ncbi:hypothetical protein HYC85_001828 [Camellia sinensis]|uniref:Uncharacterized protein n=1 Tax=Camellia sinensis TaxID=4442 RepID=A0A7J7I6Q2_CAMSI|nr:hypothetical protein HYC85_001828 [Camellia sinensis]